jgi:hypothetical protein
MFHKLDLFLSAGAWWGMSAELGLIERAIAKVVEFSRIQWNVP